MPEWVRLAEAAKAPKSYREKVAVLGERPTRAVAALIALHYEAVDIIARLAELVDRGANPVLVDKAANTMQRWNDAVREAGGLVRKV
jgi:hypothetical protein